MVLCARRVEKVKVREQMKAIIFDCDGVLVDSEVVGLDETVAFLEGHGFSWSSAEIVRRFTGMRQDKLIEGLGAEYAKILGYPPKSDQVKMIFEGLVEARRRNRDKMTEVLGAGKMLAGLARPMAVASSSQATFLEDKLKRYGLWDFFAPHVYSADCVAHGKPAPDIFLYTAERLAYAPENCLVIEDSAHGVVAGCAAGMEVWGFVGGGHCFEGHGLRLREAGATRVLTDHVALAKALALL